MLRAYVRISGLLLLAAAFWMSMAGSAFAVDPVLPSGCEIHPDQELSLALWSYDNPNATSVNVPLGSDNVFIQAPNFRSGQPTNFDPGYVENAFVVAFNYQRTPQLAWYLQGHTATVGQDTRCQAPGAPQSVEPPSIQGDPTAGSTVTLDPGTWTGPATVRLEYRIDVCDGAAGCMPYSLGTFSPIAGPLSYSVPSDIGGRRLRLSVIGYSTRGIASVSSALTAPVGPSDPPAAAPTHRPSSDTSIQIVGDRAVVPPAQQLWDGAPAPAVTQQWQRCTPGCADIPGDTGLSHRIVAADVGNSLQVVTTATNDSGTATMTSSVSVSSVPSSDNEPVPLELPHLSGTAGVGLPLHASAGTWAGDDTPDVQWQRCDATACTDIAGATADDYTPTAADAGSQLRAMVTGRNDTVPTSGFSPATFPIATELTAAVTKGPQSLAAPQIAGSRDVGSPIQLSSVGSWGAPLDGRTTTWERCSGGRCDPIAGATGDAYVPTSADAGSSLRAVVAARSAGGVTSAASSQLGPIGWVHATSAPTITGDSVEGGKLLASSGGWIGTPAPAFAGQWLSCDRAGNACTAILGATGLLYRPDALDVGHALRFRVSGGNGFSSDEVTSAPTAVVAAGATVPRDRTAPKLSRVSLSPRRFRVARARTILAARARRGARLRFRLSETAFVRVDVLRTHHRAVLGTITRVARAGATSLLFSGRLGSKALRPGTYVARLRATDAAGNRSAVKAVHFRTVRR